MFNEETVSYLRSKFIFRDINKAPAATGCIAAKQTLTDAFYRCAPVSPKHHLHRARSDGPK
jgi:hypothetical protein